MLPRRARLSRDGFTKVIPGGKRLTSEHFSVVFSSRARGYAVVVPKKAERLSARRHLLKRRVFAALRTLPLPPALIVFPRSSALALQYGAIREELSALLSKIPNSP